MNGSEWKDKSQYKRLELLLNSHIIDEQIFNLLDNIRDIRNGCLHFDEEFKCKSNNTLKRDSLQVLNDFKKTIALLLGIDNDNQRFNLDILTEIINSTFSDINSSNNFVKGFEDLKYRLRNSLSQLFGMDLTFRPSKNKVTDEGLFVVRELDLSSMEIDLLNIENSMPVIVDLNESNIKHIKEEDIHEGDKVYAIITSSISSIGLSEQWNLFKINKLIR